MPKETSLMNRLRPLLLLLALLALLCGMWAGLLRLGWTWPVLRPTLPMSHGPLMVCGFLGTLITLERAVAVRRLWSYAGPIFSGLGSLLLIWNGQVPAGPLLLALGSLWLVMIFAQIVRQHPSLFTLTMAAGAGCWLAGNLLWLFGRPVYHVVEWWTAFLVLTIAGERLELSRVQRLPQLSLVLFLAVCGSIGLALGLSLWQLSPAARLLGAAYLALALWLLRYDLARRTVRTAGLTRFIAICLLSGYFWLAFGGGWSAWHGAFFAGPIYDIQLHTIFLGFVFSMIFGHAPIILPAVLGRPITYRPQLYLPLGLLHLSLLLRVIGGWMVIPALRQWGGILNAIAILAFFALFAAATRGRLKPDRLNKRDPQCNC